MLTTILVLRVRNFCNITTWEEEVVMVVQSQIVQTVVKLLTNVKKIIYNSKYLHNRYYDCYYEWW